MAGVDTAVDDRYLHALPRSIATDLAPDIGDLVQQYRTIENHTKLPDGQYPLHAGQRRQLRSGVIRNLYDEGVRHGIDCIQHLRLPLLDPRPELLLLATHARPMGG